MKLYNFFRSGTSHRLRIALNLKGLQYEYLPVNLRTEQHLTPEFRALNPQRLVPALVNEGKVLTQSPAIIKWLEERYPTHADYVAKVTTAANSLVSQRLLLPEDAVFLIDQANAAAVP